MKYQRKTAPFAILSTPLLTLALALSIGIGTSIRADAATKGVSESKVLAACKRTPSCHFNGNRKGDGPGCTDNVCFMCSKGKCWADMKGKTPGKGAVIGGIRLPPGTVQPTSGGNSGGKTTRRPLNVGVTNGPTQAKTPLAVRQGGGMHHGGRSH